MQRAIGRFIMIRAGKLRSKLYVQDPIIEYGNVKGYQLSNGPIVRCEYLRTRAKEQEGDAGTFGINEQRIRTRYRTDITYQTKLSDQANSGRLFDVTGIENVQNLNRELIITIEEQKRG